MNFALETKMVPYVKFHYMNEKAFDETCWACDFCLKSGIYRPDCLPHGLVCDHYKFLRNYFDISCQEDRVEYIAAVVKLRNSLTDSKECHPDRNRNILNAM